MSRSILFVALLGAASVVFGHMSVAQSGTWTAKAPIPQARSLPGIAERDGRLYIVGGANAGGDVAALQVYNPLTNTWSPKSSMLAGKHGMAVGIASGKLYAAGGCCPIDGTMQVYDFASNAWAFGLSMLQATETKGAVIDQIFYVLGGNASGSCSATLQAYDTVAGTWSFRSSMPTPRCGLAVVALDGILYGLGGSDTSGSFWYSTVEAYDPATDTWTTKASIPTARSNVDATVVDGRIYVIGGSNGSGVLTTVEAYNPFTDMWSTEAPLSVARGAAAVGAANGVVYATGGYDGSTAVSIVDALQPMDPQASAWTTKAPVPQARSLAGIAERDGRLYIVGGANAGGEVAAVDVYDPLTNTWSPTGPMLAGKHGMAVGIAAGKLYAAGGCCPIDGSMQIYDFAANAWTFGVSMPQPTETKGAVIDQVFYVLGGNASGACSATLQAYDTVLGAWSFKSSMPTPRCGLAVVALDGILYGIGGSDTSGSFWYSTVEAYDPATDTWTTKASMPTARSGVDATALDGRIYVVGGSNGSGVLTTVEAYDPFTNTWSTEPSLSVACSAAAVGAANGLVYAAGGYDGFTGVASVGALDPENVYPSFCFGDGSGTLCSCGNVGAGGHGCANSVDGNGALLTATGVASLAADSVVLRGSEMPNSSCLYFQGTSQQSSGNGAVFGDGLRCASGSVLRLGTKNNADGASQYPSTGDPSLSVKGLVTAPGARTYQAWYRNAATFCTSSTFNLTNGVLINWAP